MHRQNNDFGTLNKNIKKIYFDSELEDDTTIRNFRIVQTEGSRQVTRDTKHYNLQMIIAVDFKVNNERTVQFRNFANKNIWFSLAYDINSVVLGC